VIIILISVAADLGSLVKLHPRPLLLLLHHLLLLLRHIMHWLPFAKVSLSLSLFLSLYIYTYIYIIHI